MISLFKDLNRSDFSSDEEFEDAIKKQEALRTGASAITGATSNMTGSLIGGGYSSEAGSALQTLGTAAAALPFPYGMAASAALNISGGIANRVLGSSTNTAKLNAANDAISKAAGWESDAKDISSLLSDYKNAPTTIDTSGVYKGGPLSGARRKQRDLERRANDALSRKMGTLNSTIDNIMENNNMTAVYAAEGGTLPQMQDFQQNSENYNQDITTINNGGTHEENPLEGVPMGVAPDGKPNLVEEGEVIWEDFVFSNRIQIPEEIKKRYGIKRKVNTFADAANAIKDNLDERPNDPYTKATVDATLASLAEDQEQVKQKQEIDRQDEEMLQQALLEREAQQQVPEEEALSPEEQLAMRGNPNEEALQQMIQEQAMGGMPIEETPENVEENEPSISANGGYLHKFGEGDKLYTINDFPKLNSYDSSSSLIKQDFDGLLKKFDAGPNYNPYKYSNLDPYKYSNPNSYNPPFSYKPLTLPKPDFTLAPIIKQQLEEQRKKLNSNKKSESENPYSPSRASLLRYAPALGTGVFALTDLMGITGKPDNTTSNLLLNHFNRPNEKITPGFLGDYLRDRRFDTTYYGNQLGAQSVGQRRTIQNLSNMNRGQAIASILSSDANNINGLGELYRKGEDFNLDYDKTRATFNRETNDANIKNRMHADEFNAKVNDDKLQLLIQAATLRQREKEAAEKARSANLTSFLQNLGNIGTEAYYTNQRKWMGKRGLFGTNDYESYINIYNRLKKNGMSDKNIHSVMIDLFGSSPYDEKETESNSSTSKKKEEESK